MIRRFLILAATALFVACATTSPDRAVAAADVRDEEPGFRYGRNPGPSPVGAIPDVLLNDAARRRSVKISIDYPTKGGPHPLIVFSHGGGGSNRGYPGLSAHWASYGYVVIRPAHDDHARAEEMTTAEWRDRTRDISFVIDSLATLAETYPELAGKIDPTKIAVAGHSRGATTAMLIGGMRLFPGPVSFADPRVKAVVAMSPNGPREMWGVTDESWADLRVPTLFMTGTRDTGANESETPQWRQQAFEFSPAGDKWLATIDGVDHGTFTGQVTSSGERRPGVVTEAVPTQAEIERQRQNPNARAGRPNALMRFDVIRSLALAFFDAYLKEDPKGRKFLEDADARMNVEMKRK